MRIGQLNLRAYFGPGGSQIADLANLSHPTSRMWCCCKKHHVRAGSRSSVARPGYVARFRLTRTFPSRGSEAMGARSPCGPRWASTESGGWSPQGSRRRVVAGAIDEPVPDSYEVLPAALAARFSCRTLLAAISGSERPFVAATFHATPGTGQVGGKLVSEWKPFFHGAAAVALAELKQPFMFAIDANEPRAETLDSVAFHWADGRPGAAKFAALLGLSPLHRARDLQRELMAKTGDLPARPDTWRSPTRPVAAARPQAGVADLIRCGRHPSSRSKRWKLLR